MRDQYTFERGQHVSDWTLLEYRPSSVAAGRRKSSWKCICSCGTVRFVKSANLASGSSKSCGHRLREALNLPPVNSVFALGDQHARQA